MIRHRYPATPPATNTTTPSPMQVGIFALLELLLTVFGAVPDFLLEQLYLDLCATPMVYFLGLGPSLSSPYNRTEPAESWK